MIIDNTPVADYFINKYQNFVIRQDQFCEQLVEKPIYCEPSDDLAKYLAFLNQAASGTSIATPST